MVHQKSSDANINRNHQKIFVCVYFLFGLLLSSYINIKLKICIWIKVYVQLFHIITVHDRFCHIIKTNSKFSWGGGGNSFIMFQSINQFLCDWCVQEAEKRTLCYSYSCIDDCRLLVLFVINNECDFVIGRSMHHQAVKQTEERNFLWIWIY